MTSAKISDFFDPLVTVKNQLIVFLLSAFWGPPPPPTADVIYGSPHTKGRKDEEDSLGEKIFLFARQHSPRPF